MKQHISLPKLNLNMIKSYFKIQLLKIFDKFCYLRSYLTYGPKYPSTYVKGASYVNMDCFSFNFKFNYNYL